MQESYYLTLTRPRVHAEAHAAHAHTGISEFAMSECTLPTLLGDDRREVGRSSPRQIFSRDYQSCPNRVFKRAPLADREI